MTWALLSVGAGTVVILILIVYMVYTQGVGAGASKEKNSWLEKKLEGKRQAEERMRKYAKDSEVLAVDLSDKRRAVRERVSKVLSGDDRMSKGS